MENSMFETLLELPLFQGLGQSDLTRILESTRLSFHSPASGQLVVEEGTPCTGLTFLIGGTVVVTTYSADRSWHVDEEMSARSVLGLEVLYGGTRTHQHSVRALSEDVRTMFMDKRTVSALIAYYEVFRLNVLNRLTTQTVRNRQALWMPSPRDLQGRIVFFMRSHVQHPAGRKVFHISQTQLGHYLGEDYRYTGKALHGMEERGLVRLRRRSIEVPSFEALLQSDLWKI